MTLPTMSRVAGIRIAMPWFLTSQLNSRERRLRLAGVHLQAGSFRKPHFPAAYRKLGWASEAILLGAIWGRPPRGPNGASMSRNDDADDSPRDITEDPVRLSLQRAQVIRWINPTLRARRLGFPIPNKKISTPSGASSMYVGVVPPEPVLRDAS
jgi:hypothetical protein